jgi:serine/threonine kinase 16
MCFRMLLGIITVGLYFIFHAKNGTLFDEIEIHSKKLKHLSDEKIAKLMFGLCNALQCMHDANLAHRDLKPQNILLNDDKTESVLTDFGSVTERIISIKDNRKSQEVQDWACENCSMFYKPPELFSPQINTQINEMADVWSMGCNLFTTMYNKGPFDYVAEKGDSIALAVSSARFTMPDTPKRSEILVGIVKGTIVVDAHSRLTISQIACELKKLLNNTGTGNC